MKQTFLLLLVQLVSFGALYGQQPVQIVKGRVTDTQSGSALPGATVVLGGSNPVKGTVTDAEGFFRMPGVPLGRQVLHVSFLGYGSLTIPDVLVTSGKEVSLEIRLEEQVIKAEEVVVKAKRDQELLLNEFGTVSARSFYIENTRRFAGSRNDPSRMAANFAGVSGSNDARNDIVIRGSSPAGLLWRLDGVDIPNPSHFGALGATGGPVSIINNNVLGRSDFFTGAFPADYGNALSGVFDLQLRTGNRDKREFTGQVGFNGFELGIEGPFSKGKNATYLLHYRYSVLGLVQKLGLAPGTGSGIPNYQDVAFKIDLPTGRPGSRWSIFGIGGTSDVTFKGSLKDTANLYSDPYSNLRNAAGMGVGGISYTHYFDVNTHLQTTVALSHGAFRTRIDSLDDAREAHPHYRDVSSQGRATVTTRMTRKLSARHLVSAGLYYNRLSYSLSDSSLTNGRFRTIRDRKGNTDLAQAFVQWQYKPVDRLTLNTGLHGSWFALNGDYAAEPRVGLKYGLPAGQTLSLAGSLNSQIQPLQLYFVQTPAGAGNYRTTNHHLSMTRGAQVVFGYDRFIGERIRLKLEGYYQHLYKAPVETAPSSFSGLNLGASFGASDIDSLLSKGKGRNYGAEITLERAFEKGYYFLATLSVFDSKATGSDGIRRNTAFSNKYVGNLLGGKEWRMGEKNSLALDVRVTSAGGRPYIPIDPLRSVTAGAEVPDLEKAYQLRFRNYFRTDLKITYRRDEKKWTHEWFIDFQNLANTKNVFTQTFDARSGKIRTQYQIPLYITFNYRIEF